MVIDLEVTPLIRPIETGDIGQVFELWGSSSGVDVEEWETPELLAEVIRQPHITSYVAVVNDLIVAAILAGNCGLRGLIQHLAVRQEYQRRGVGKALVEQCTLTLQQQGIQRILFGVKDRAAIEFWKACGFRHNESVIQMWKDT